MRRDVLELRRFYASPLGRAAREMTARKVFETWGQGQGLDVLGLGYATPFLGGMTSRARRVIAAMPAQQGVEIWPGDQANLACLTGEDRLPFRNALFDRILAVHALEESSDALGLLREAWRVLSPSGRIVVVVAARNGLWANAETTPFGHGRPYSRGQLADLLREAELEPSGWTRALYVPPVAWMAGWAEGFEQAGSRLWSGFSGLVLMEAVKQTFAVKPRAARQRVRAQVLSPLPAGRMPIPEAQALIGLGKRLASAKEGHSLASAGQRQPHPAGDEP